MTGPSVADLEQRLAKTASTKTENSREHADALLALAWAIRLSEPERAHKLAEKARELSRQHDYALGQARAARILAMTPMDAEDAAAIFALANEAKTLFDEAGDLEGRAASRDFLASIYEHIGDLAGAMELALDALSLARELGDPVRQAYALCNVGGILAASGEFDPAIERLEAASALFAEGGNSDGLASTYSRLTRVLRDAGRNTQALEYAARCHKTTAADGGDYVRWTAYTVEAEIQQERGDLDEAERLHRAALECWSNDLGKNLLGAETRVALARLLVKKGALEVAEREVADVLSRISGDAVSVLAESDARDAMAEILEHKGDYAAAVEQLRQAQTLKEQIWRRDARNKLARVEARAATEAAKKDAEIHKLKFVELHAMQAKLVEAEKMALLGRLAAGTAHELNTPLAVLSNNNQVTATAVERLVTLLQTTPDGQLVPRAHHQARKLASVLQSSRASNEQAIARMVAIAHGFERFTQLDQAERRAFDVHEGLRSALTLLEPTLPETIVIERHFEPVPKIEAWPRELNFAFLTVLQNAVDALAGRGTIALETATTLQSVLVLVRDTGRGMSPEHVAHLFDVAWSDDGQRTRMRLGLSAAYATMQKHGGAIEAQSTLGEGTTVTFRFPIPR